MMEGLLAANPAMAAAMSANPEMRAAFTSPETLRRLTDPVRKKGGPRPSVCSRVYARARCF